MSEAPITLAVLISGGGTTVANLADEIAAGRLNAKIGIVIASRSNCAGVARARSYGLPVVVIERHAEADAQMFSEHVFRLCEAADAELACMAGWLSVTPIPQRWLGRVVNIHPSLLPSFGGKGMWGQKVHQAVLDHGCKVSGCTVHLVDDAVDAGPIILQRTCEVDDTDTAATLAQRVFELEKRAYPEAIRLFHQKRLTMNGRKVCINRTPQV